VSLSQISGSNNPNRVLCNILFHSLCTSHDRWDNFHGARTSDAHVAAVAVRQALGSEQALVGGILWARMRS
jgi:hypothetical protein